MDSKARYPCRFTVTDKTDPNSLAALSERHGERYRWLLLLSVMVGTMASIMSSTIVNVAIPDMSQHFVVGQERAQWVTSGFMVSMTVSMLTTPWLLARYGYRATYNACMWLLLVGGVVGGFANTFELVLAARVAEGLAAGVVQPIPAIIILRAFQPHEQGRASGIFGMGVVLAPAIGPTIGGVLVDLLGWRSIFFMVVPFCLASLWLASRFVPNTAPGGVAANRQGNALDWRGLLLATAGTLCLLNGLVELRGGTPLTASLLVGGAAVALAAFIAWQWHMLRRARADTRAQEPLMNLGDRHYGRMRAATIAWLDRVELDTRRIDDKPRNFSGGMQQRIQVARNLIHGPRLVFMDEPTGGLDVSVQARLLDLLRELVRDLNLAVIIVTHDMAVARLMADRLLVMKSGFVVETGLTDQVLDDPQHPYTQLLVSSVLQI